MLPGMVAAEVEIPAADQEDPHSGSRAATVTCLHHAKFVTLLETEPSGHTDIVLAARVMGIIQYR